MASITNAVNMSFRVDRDLKKQADVLFKSLGLNTSVALNMFLTQSVREQALPFTPDMKTSVPSKELKKAIKEADDIASGKIKTKTYNNAKELFDDLR